MKIVTAHTKWQQLWRKYLVNEMLLLFLVEKWLSCWATTRNKLKIIALQIKEVSSGGRPWHRKQPLESRFSQSLVHKDSSCFYWSGLTKKNQKLKGWGQGECQNHSFVYGIVCLQDTHPPERQQKDLAFFHLSQGHCHMIWLL